MAQLNSGYSSSEVMAMQRDAIERVREMQRRSQEKLQQTSIPTPPPVQAQPPAIAVQTHVPPPRTVLPEPSQAPPVHHPRSNPTPPPSQSSPLQSLLGGILGDMDGEKIMLLLLIYLLAKEGADQMLILALLYLII